MIPSLSKITESSSHLNRVRREELQFGDLVMISTRNSVYRVRILGDDSYQVSGGWFDQGQLSPIRIGINGCTWGGSIIQSNVVAACGLHLEFDNGVVTTAIQKIWLLKYGTKN